MVPGVGYRRRAWRRRCGEKANRLRRMLRASCFSARLGLDFGFDFGFGFDLVAILVAILLYEAVGVGALLFLVI